MFEFPEDLHRAWCSIITAATSKQSWKKGELDPKTKRPLEMHVCKVMSLPIHTPTILGSETQLPRII